MDYKLRRFDWALFFIFLALSAVGLVSTSGIGDAVRPFFQKQLIFLAAGVFIIFLVSLFDYRIFKNNSFATIILYALAVVLLFISLASESVRGINAWIIVGNFRLEPSEFAKLALIILVAKYFSQKNSEIFKVHHILASGVYMAVPLLLVLKQPDLGSAFIFFVIWLSILLAAGVKRKHLLMIIFSAILMMLVAWLGFLEPYQKSRITTFLNPYLDPKGEGYSIIQSKIAIGSGGLWGKGFGHGTQAGLGFLPEAHTDFAFASFAEQFGFAGILTIFSLFVALLFKISKIGFSAKNNFAKLFSVGLIAFIFSHVVINAGMNLGLLPITGIPLPFLSYGGSFLISVSLGIGFLESIKIRST